MASQYKVLTASGVITSSGPGRLHSIVVEGGTSASDVVVYDNTTNSGSIIFQANTAANTSLVTGQLCEQGVRYATGLYAVLTNADSITVYFD